MRALITILAVFLLAFSPQDYEYKWGIPTTEGINKYVEANQYVFIEEYQEFVDDTLIYEPFISTDDLRDYVGLGDASGFFERPDNIVVDNRQRYVDYELRRWSEERKNRYSGNNMFVRGVVIHELTHCYIYQIVMRAQYDKKLAYEWQQGLRIIPVDNYHTQFCEEGFCEAVVELMGELIPYPDELGISRADLSPSRRESYEVKYMYSSRVVMPLIEQWGLKAAIYLVITNKPPSNEEILSPEIYYKRLSWK